MKTSIIFKQFCLKKERNFAMIWGNKKKLVLSYIILLLKEM